MPENSPFRHWSVKPPPEIVLPPKIAEPIPTVAPATTPPVQIPAAPVWNGLDGLARVVVAELGAIGVDPDAAAAPVSPRELFLELLTLAMANLFNRMPLPSWLFDRTILKSVAGDVDDNELTKLAGKAEDWIRTEGLVRVQEGQKSYALSLPAIAALSTMTPEGTLGELMERARRCYARQAETPQLRRLTRQLGATFLNLMAGKQGPGA